MGRYVDLNQPLSDEDRAYLHARSRSGQVAVNDRQFGDLSQEGRDKARSQAAADAVADSEDAEAWEAAEKDAESDFDDDFIESVGPLKVAELRQSLVKRDLPTDGSKTDLQERLLNYLQDERDEAAKTAGP